jgi:hypothetical protein
MPCQLARRSRRAGPHAGRRLRTCSKISATDAHASPPSLQTRSACSARLRHERGVAAPARSQRAAAGTGCMLHRRARTSLVFCRSLLCRCPPHAASLVSAGPGVVREEAQAASHTWHQPVFKRTRHHATQHAGAARGAAGCGGHTQHPKATRRVPGLVRGVARAQAGMGGPRTKSNTIVSVATRCAIVVTKRAGSVMCSTAYGMASQACAVRGAPVLNHAHRRCAARAPKT